MRATRRNILGLGASCALLAAGPAALLGRADAQTTTPRVRRDVHTLAPDDPILATYRNAVRYMRGLSSTNRRSWAYQAGIHSNRCPHQNWYFLPWHRQYVLAFENIIRSLPVTGASTFVLPYWDWTVNPQLPAAFTQPTWDGRTNPLYDSTRVPGAGDAVPSEFTGRQVMDSIYLLTSFASFASSRPSGQNSLSGSWQRRRGTYGQLEGGPHNNVHRWIGGNMGDPPTAALDPVFWLHHAHIDRIWASWNAQGRANTTNTLWRDFTFSQNFARTDGTLYSIRVRNITMSAYSYDRLDPAPGATAQASALSLETETFGVAAVGEAPAGGGSPGILRIPNGRSAAVGRPASIPVPLGGRGRSLPSRAVLRLLDIPVHDVADAPFIRVFLNHPSIGPGTPPSGPHYVGTVSFFGGHGHGGGGNLFSFTLNLAPALESQRRAGQATGDTLTVQIVPVDLGRPTVQAIEIEPAAVEIEFQ